METLLRSLLIASILLASSACSHGQIIDTYCEEKGGIHQFTKSPRQVGVCSFGDAAIGGETFMRSRVGLNQRAVEEFCKSEDNPTLYGEIPGPIYTYCRRVGGQVVKYKLRSGKPMALCEFDDKSKIEVSTLFFGHRDSRNWDLHKLLECEWELNL